MAHATYFVIALGIFPQLGYARVWGKLTAGLGGHGCASTRKDVKE